MKDTVYYLPGMGGRLKTGLGKGIQDRGFNVMGRETLGEFQRYSFQDKIDIVATDLEGHFWYKEAKVIVNSFGAYLFFHAQLQLPPFPGKTLILSPIIGASRNSDLHMRFYPPRADVLTDTAQGGGFPCPLNAQIQVGSEDWQSGSADVVTFGKGIGVPVTVVAGEGHMMSLDYVGGLLDKQLE